MASLLVKDLMVNHPLAIQQGTELTTVVSTLLQSRYSGLPVVDQERRVIGFVSEQDCLRRLLVTSYHSEGSERVEELMHSEPLTVLENQSVVNIAEMMIKQKPKIYPVLDEGGRLTGLLTRRMVLRALNDSRKA